MVELYLGEELVGDYELLEEEAEAELVPLLDYIVCKLRHQEPLTLIHPDGWFLTVEEEQERRLVLVPDSRISGPNLRWG